MAARDEKQHKRARIISAAVDVFADKGFHAARVSDIARGAGVADGTIYLYFDSKDQLLLSIFEETMDMLRDGLVEALAGIEDPLEQVRAFARYHFGQVRDHRAVAEVLQVELRTSSKFMRDYKPSKLWEYLKVFRGIIEAGQASGSVREDVDPFTLMWAFFGSLDELGVQWALARDRQRIDLEAAAEQVADLFIRGIAK